MRALRLKRHIQREIFNFICDTKSLQLASITDKGQPYASFAPYAVGRDCLYVLLSELAVHGNNLLNNPVASVLIAEEQKKSRGLLQGRHLRYSVKAEFLSVDCSTWLEGIAFLAVRHGDGINRLSQLADFRLFGLRPFGGVYERADGAGFVWDSADFAGDEIRQFCTKGLQLKAV